MQDKLTPSEQLGDLLKQAGDNDAALKCYQTSNVPQKVIEGLAAKGDFVQLSQLCHISGERSAPVTCCVTVSGCYAIYMCGISAQHAAA